VCKFVNFFELKLTPTHNRHKRSIKFFRFFFFFFSSFFLRSSKRKELCIKWRSFTVMKWVSEWERERDERKYFSTVLLFFFFFEEKNIKYLARVARYTNADNCLIGVGARNSYWKWVSSRCCYFLHLSHSLSSFQYKNDFTTLRFSFPVFLSTRAY
jgi:hypothetical protein